MDRLAMTRLRLAVLLVGILAALAPAASRASERSQLSNSKWHASDQCTREAFRRFPDYNADSNSKRETFRRQCLRAQNLPVPDGGTPLAR
jgi:hypothetical protein